MAPLAVLIGGAELKTPARNKNERRALPPYENQETCPGR